MTKSPLNAMQRACGVDSLTNPATGLLMTAGFDSTDSSGQRYGYNQVETQTRKSNQDVANAHPRMFTEEQLRERLRACCNEHRTEDQSLVSPRSTAYRSSAPKPKTRAMVKHFESAWFYEGENDDDSGAYHSDDTDSLFDDDTTSINPATGYPMIGGTCGVDACGNHYGSNDHDLNSHAWDGYGSDDHWEDSSDSWSDSNDSWGGTSDDIWSDNSTGCDGFGDSFTMSSFDD